MNPDNQFTKNFYKNSDSIEDAEIIEETPYSTPVPIAPEYTKASIEENPEARYQLVKSIIVDKITDIKEREFTQKAEEKKDPAAVEFFKSRVGGKFGLSSKEISIPRDHPMLPVFEYAQKLINENGKDGQTYFGTDTYSKSGETIEIEPTIEKGLQAIFYPGYSGEGKIPGEVPPEVQEILDFLGRGSEEGKTPRSGEFNSKIGQACFELSSSFANSFEKKSVDEIIEIFNTTIAGPELEKLDEGVLNG